MEGAQGICSEDTISILMNQRKYGQDDENHNESDRNIKEK
jgi:hypothetical protein